MSFVLHERAQSVDQRHDSGPFDIIGDVHGCADELEDLLRLLGYVQTGRTSWQSPTGRTPVFVGDLVDRQDLDVLEEYVDEGLVAHGPGQHDVDPVSRQDEARHALHVVHAQRDGLHSFGQDGREGRSRIGSLVPMAVSTCRSPSLASSRSEL